MRLTAIELRHTDQGRVARLAIPGGVLDARSASEVAVAAASIGEDRTVRVVVVSARGQVFCTGPAEDLDVFDLRPDPASALASLRVPVVAVLEGQCRAEGLEMALTADLRVGGDNTVLALDHVLSGRVPAWGGSCSRPRAVNLRNPDTRGSWSGRWKRTTPRAGSTPR